MDSILDLIGKFHPLLLHLPIGVLIYAYLHLGFDLMVRKKAQPVDIGFALGVGALSAVMSSVSGYLLSLNGEYSGDLLDWHKWLGIGTAVGSILLFVLYRKSKNQKGFFILFTVFMALLTATGHYGGSLTHGEGFLSLDDSNEIAPIEISDVNQANVFEHLIMPIVDRKCISCHNPKKMKGDLLLDSVDGWKKGGKTGKFLVAGDLENSLMSIRAHLPSEDKEHMPPAGKLQLEKEEIVLIDWWISKMANYTQKVADLSPPAHIMKYIESKLDYATVGVPELMDADVAAMQAKGIPVQRINEDKPWVSISYTRGRSISKSDLSTMLDLNENIRELKLSKVGLTDKMLSKINEMTNLSVLDISLNGISTQGVAKLSDLKKLESINLYGTKVDDKLLDQLSNFPSVKRVFLWQTNISNESIVAANLPSELEVNLGQDLEVFGEVKLSPPIIIASKDLFTDTMSVTISHQGAKAKVRYTIDGTEPNASSPIYSEPIILSRTATVQTNVSMEGWETSDIVKRSFLRSKYAVSQAKIDPEANEKYAAEGSATLFDMEKGSNVFSDGKWLGFSAQDVSIILDLKEIQEVNSVSFGSLIDFRSYIFNPIGVSIFFSNDGIDFNAIASEDYKQITGPEENVVNNFLIDIPQTKTRYIKLDLVAQKKNPDWHSDPGADCWLFLDEVVVE